MSDLTQIDGLATPARFRLSFIALAVYGAALATLIWLGVWLDFGDAPRLRRMIIRMFVWFPLLYGVGWVVYRIARRSSLAGSIAFGCAAALVGGLNVALLVGLDKRAKGNAEVEALNRLGSQLRAEEAAAASKGLAVDMDSPKRMEARRKLEELSRVPGEEGAAHRASAAAMQEVERLTRVYNELLAAMDPDGAIDDAVLRDGEARKRRITHVETTVGACAELERFFGGYDEFVHARARQEGAGEAMAAKLRDSLKAHPRLPIQREFYRCARESFETIARMLALLDDPARRWELDPEVGIRFEEAADRAAWIAAAERLQLLESEQQRIQQRLLKD